MTQGYEYTEGRMEMGAILVTAFLLALPLIATMVYGRELENCVNYAVSGFVSCGITVFFLYFMATGDTGKQPAGARHGKRRR